MCLIDYCLLQDPLMLDDLQSTYESLVVSYLTIPVSYATLHVSYLTILKIICTTVHGKLCLFQLGADPIGSKHRNAKKLLTTVRIHAWMNDVTPVTIARSLDSLRRYLNNRSLVMRSEVTVYITKSG